MRMLSDRLHWLAVGLAFLVGTQGFSGSAHAQAPSKPGSMSSKKGQSQDYNSMPSGGMVAPAGYMPPGYGPGMPGAGMGGVQPAAGMSFAMPGPAPGEVVYGDTGCDGMGGCCGMCGGMCGGGPLSGMKGKLGACRSCGGMGCRDCGGSGGCSTLFDGRLLGLLGPLAPYSEGSASAQRWFDLYAGTIGLRRTSDFGPFSSSVQDPQTGAFLPSNLISTDGINGTPVLRSNDLDLDKMRYGLELIGNIQTGPGANIEARYFGLNNWSVSQTVRLQTPNLFSVFSQFGTNPNNGFDDTDRSFIHTISYNSELHNGELNYRRRWVSPVRSIQGSWLAGVRYFDLDERFGFAATGSNNNTFTFSQLRFANIDTNTRNQMTGFQIGGDAWLGIAPGLSIGSEAKAGIYGNHAEVESQVISNSVLGASEFLQTGKTAYLTEITTSIVYRITYSWSVRASYNMLYVDNVALAAENLNTRDLSNALGGGAFTANRFPFINVDGEVFYQGFSVGGEWLY